MSKLIFATNNPGKLTELKTKLPSFEIIGLKQAGIDVDIPETGNTLKENAQIKARFIWDNYKVSCFADDTGLEIEALNGEPGVFSARYAGPQKKAEDNMTKVLTGLANQTNRRAHFKTAICLILNGTSHFFEGICKGTITNNRRGEEGFGYDPIFKPDGFDKTLSLIHI